MSRSHPQAAAAAALAISQLPDDVLAHSFSFLSQSERLASSCLVSKRFYALCTSPLLLQQLEAFCRGVAGAESLLLFLARHGRHVATLRLIVMRRSDESDADLTAAVASCLSVVGAKGQLRKLELESVYGGSQETSAPLPPTVWLPTLRGLRQLRMVAQRNTRFARGADALRTLESMCLHGSWVFDVAAALPPCLTHLALNGSTALEMPSQVLHLSRLRSLDLNNHSFSSASMEGLSRLGSLTRLQLQECTPPAGLSALSPLRHLDVHFWSDSPGEEELDAALGGLRQLTTLVLGGYVGCHRLPAIAGLPQLERFYWDSMPEEGAQLPDGPWLHSISWLCLSPELLCSSVGVMAAAPNLELVGFEAAPSWRLTQSPAWRQFWAWAARHPPLHGLHLDFEAGTDEENTVWYLMDELVRLVSIRPAFALSRLEQRAFCDMLETELV